MTAKEVKEALRGRHPAFADIGLGPWTCLEEFANIDLVAFSAWSSKGPPIVGYEVKISRSDYRRELLKPEKRRANVDRCWQFSFAVPKGLLSKEEKAYVEPGRFEDGSAFEREKCPERCTKLVGRKRKESKATTPEEKRRARLSGRTIRVPVAYGEEACWLQHDWRAKRGEIVVPERAHFERHTEVREVCETCEGRGYLRKSIVEEEAPTLWIPNDVGLVEVDPESGRCHTVRKAPRSEPTLTFDLTSLVRWSSFRPDPRHAQAA